MILMRSGRIFFLSITRLMKSPVANGSPSGVRRSRVRWAMRPMMMPVITSWVRASPRLVVSGSSWVSAPRRSRNGSSLWVCHERCLQSRILSICATRDLRGAMSRNGRVRCRIWLIVLDTGSWEGIVWPERSPASFTSSHTLPGWWSRSLAVDPHRANG